MNKLKILVFPCGSEIGLEVHRSLQYSTHVELVGANSIDDHGRFIFKKYINGIPFIDSVKAIPALKNIVQSNNIDAIYPTMDKVIWKLKKHESELGCKVIASPYETTEICLSKRSTYTKLSTIIKTPKLYENSEQINTFPVFVKPNIGYGTRDIFKANDYKDLEWFLKERNKEDYIISEYLPGDEYTVDSFTNRKGKLLFSKPRIRKRISNGISVNTKPVLDNLNEFINIANLINDNLTLRGAWFFQVKKDKNGKLTLLEVAARLGGSSSLFRGKGVNFALMSVFDMFDFDVEVVENNYDIEVDRALDIKYNISYNFEVVYTDFDDCLIINDKVNTNLIKFLYSVINAKKKVILLTKHNGQIKQQLEKYRLNNLFDKVIHIKPLENKTKYINNKKSIFIDDSFLERKKVHDELNIPVFAPDMIEVFM
jgi:hypothetical protein